MFNPHDLAHVDASFDPDVEVSVADDDALRRLVGEGIRQRCVGLKLASRIVGMATATSAELADQDILNSLNGVMTRLHTLRQLAISAIGIKPDHPDFSVAFNVLTPIMLDAVMEEWKWGRLAAHDARALPPGLLRQVLLMAIRISPERYEVTGEPQDAGLTRRLAVMSMIPRLHGLLNLFDFCRADRDGFIQAMARQVLRTADEGARDWHRVKDPSFAARDLFLRHVEMSLGMLCEVYRREASREVSRLRAMPSLDRGVLLAHYEEIGGIDYAGLFVAHDEAMARLRETADLILEANEAAVAAATPPEHAGLDEEDADDDHE